MAELVLAIALMFAIEGLVFAAFPGAMRRAMRDCAETPERVLRILGLVCAVIGVLMIWAMRGFPAIMGW